MPHSVPAEFSIGAWDLMTRVCIRNVLHPLQIGKMAPRAKDSEPTFKASLVNVAGRGLGFRDKDGIFVSISNVSLKCIAPIALQSRGLKGE